NDGTAGSEEGPAKPDADGIQRNVFHPPVVFLAIVGMLDFEAFPETENFGGRTARDQRFELPSRQGAAAKIVKELPKSGFARLNFIVTRPLNQTTHPPDVGSRVAFDSDF